jgi:amidohydrolase
MVSAAMSHGEEDSVSVSDEAGKFTDEMTELRRAIHREPEIGLHLPKTQQKILSALDGLPLEISTGTELSSVTAVLRGGKPGPAVLLRGDMDALPITEATGLPFASRHDGAMHACGHDLHVAMLAGAAKVLSARQADLTGDVVFMFQPGEEGYAGARSMIGEGVLDAAGPRVVGAYGLHVSSTKLPFGVFSTRPGPMLAAADQIFVTVHGRGGHASQPHRAADPIPAACEMVIALQTMVTRKFDVFDPVVVTVGSFHAGTADNIIPDSATFLATTGWRSTPNTGPSTRSPSTTRARRPSPGRPRPSCSVSSGPSWPTTRSPAPRTSPSCSSRCPAASSCSARARRTATRRRRHRTTPPTRCSTTPSCPTAPRCSPS